MIDLSAEATSAGMDLSRPVALDASLYTEVAPTPRERAATIAREAAAAPKPSAAETTTTSANEGGTAVGAERSAAGYAAAGATVNALEQLLTYRERGNVAFSRQDYSAAERWYDKALAVELDDGKGGMHPEYAATLNNMAACKLNCTPAEPKAAMLRLKPLLAALPKHVKARLRAGRACVMLGELQAALTHFEVALRLETPAIESREGLQLRYKAPEVPTAERAKLMDHTGKVALSEAAQQANEGKATTSRLISHCERSRTLAAAGRMDESLYLARSVARSCTHAPIGQLLAVRALEGCGRLWEAQQEADEVAEVFPDDEALGLAHARVLARRGKVAEAEYRLAALARTMPGEASRASRALKGMKRALQLKAEGNAAYASGDVDRAAACYSAGLEADVEGCLRPTLLANRAQCRLQEERYTEALGDVDSAITLDADNVKLLLRRAACYVALKQKGKAEQDYRTVLKLDASCMTAREFVGKIDAEGRKAQRDEFASGGANGAEDDDDDEIDPYDTLGVKRDANAAEIKSAYRKMALKYHPDKHADESEEARGAAEAKFQQVNLANTLLCDAVKRRQYDAGGRIRDIMK